MAHTHPRAKTTYMTNSKCLNVIHQNISLYIISCYSIIFEPYQSSQTYMLRKKKQRMADTHLSIETTYIAYPICYTMMLPNMPFRKADAHPQRLNTRCKDLTLVPSTTCVWCPLSYTHMHVDSEILPRSTSVKFVLKPRSNVNDGGFPSQTRMWDTAPAIFAPGIKRPLLLGASSQQSHNRNPSPTKMIFKPTLKKRTGGCCYSLKIVSI